MVAQTPRLNVPLSCSHFLTSNCFNRWRHLIVIEMFPPGCFFMPGRRFGVKRFFLSLNDAIGPAKFDFRRDCGGSLTKRKLEFISLDVKHSASEELNGVVRLLKMWSFPLIVCLLSRGSRGPACSLDSLHRRSLSGLEDNSASSEGSES